MPNSRCIETGAREGVYLGTQVPVTRNDVGPGAPVDRGNCNTSKLREMELFLILSRLDVYRKPIPEGP